MKAFIRNAETTFRHPEDMAKILAYLNERGKLQVSAKTIEELYSDFSEEKYCAGWMGVPDTSEDGDFPYLLEDFADWLSEIDI